MQEENLLVAYNDLNIEPEKFSGNEQTKFRKNRMMQAMHACLGVVTQACVKSGVSRSTYYEWLDEDTYFKECIESLKDVELDFVESKLHKLININSPAAIFFYLKCKGKERGYIERQEIEHSGFIKTKDIDIDNASEDELRSFVEGATATLSSEGRSQA